MSFQGVVVEKITTCSQNLGKIENSINSISCTHVIKRSNLFYKNERISIFKKTSECTNDAAITMYTYLQKKGGYEEYESFREQEHKKSSRPYWTWVVGSQIDQHYLPVYASKIGGAPAVYLGLMKMWDFY